jgi:signal transduction histidine kinase/ligand-binding sensor domain-containing protein
MICLGLFSRQHMVHLCGSIGRWEWSHARYLSAISWLFISASTLGQSPTTQALSEMYHTRWTIRDGVPSNIEAIAQTRDGYIWLGTDTGLFRFDGRRFERFQPSSGDPLSPGTIPTITATPDGGLWVGYQSAGASFLKNGHNVNFGQAEGLTAGSIDQFARDSAGVVWAASGAGLWRFDGATWTKVDAAWGYPLNHAANVFIDSRDTLWVGSGKQVLYLPKGARRFEVAAEQADSSYAMDEGPDGTVWIALIDSMQIKPLAGPDGKLIADSKSYHYASLRILFHRDGSLWICTNAQGVYRVPVAQIHSGAGTSAEDPIQHVSASDGLTSDDVRDLVHDREGGTWIVSTKGLDYFRRAALTALDLPKGWFRIAIVADGPDSILAVGKQIIRVDRLGMSIVSAPKELLRPGQIESAYRDPDGTIWLGLHDSLSRYTPTALVTVPLPDGLDPLLHVPQTMTMDRNGGLWVSFLHTGFMHYWRGQWSKPSFPSAGAHDPGLSALTDTKGRVWFGLTHNRVEVLSGNVQIRYGPEAGIRVGDVTALYDRSGQLWLGGKEGLQFQKQDRFYSLRLDGDPTIEGVSGILQRASGELWVNQASGIVRIEPGEISKALRDPDYSVKYRLYNYLDGLTDIGSQIRPNPTIVETDRGRLYIATRSGVLWIDPDEPQVPTAPPAVFVNSVTVDGKLWRDQAELHLPAGADSVEIDYTATSLLIPDRVRFRYKLDGLDKDWQEAGTRRQAYYSRLPPGRYRFRVLASNSVGVWNEGGASVALEIPPTFVQSFTFKLLCVALAAGILALLYHLRLRMLMRQIKNRLYERLAERERIARDLHDTFFQAIQGLLLRFNTATSMLTSDEPARAILEDTLKKSDDVMKEGRELVLDLRAGVGETSSLSKAFAAAEAEFLRFGDAKYRVISNGEPRELHPVVCQEAYRLGREALANAFQHSRASHIEAELIFEPSALRLRFRDDGIGIDPGVLRDGSRANHWGLPGMRERAHKISAQIDIWSHKGAGTEIEVRIPASVAYAAAKNGLGSRLAKTRFRREHKIM